MSLPLDKIPYEFRQKAIEDAKGKIALPAKLSDIHGTPAQRMKARVRIIADHGLDAWTTICHNSASDVK